MIRGFKDDRARAIFEGEAPKKGFPLALAQIARRKLNMLEAADRLEDLRAPPANRLEKLVGNRKGQHCIRINDQWRICFRWTAAGADDVEIVDHH